MAYPNQSTSGSIRDDMERAGDSASNAAQRAASSASSTAKSVGQDVSHAMNQAADVAQNQLDSMTSYVRKNPLQSTAMAAAVGFVFALIARR
jgi:ElaB/YqjD/DUF883 family membrane-anchored ribosome-binding protein